MGEETKEPEPFGCKSLRECAYLILGTNVDQVTLEDDFLDDDDEKSNTYGDMAGEYWVDAARQLAIDYLKNNPE